MRNNDGIIYLWRDEVKTLLKEGILEGPLYNEKIDAQTSFLGVLDIEKYQASSRFNRVLDLSLKKHNSNALCMENVFEDFFSEKVSADVSYYRINDLEKQIFENEC